MATSAARLAADRTSNKTPGQKEGMAKETKERKKKTEVEIKEQVRQDKERKEREKVGASKGNNCIKSAESAQSQKGKYIMLVRHAKVTPLPLFSNTITFTLKHQNRYS
jgi:hypothetical protein